MIRALTKFPHILTRFSTRCTISNRSKTLPNKHVTLWGTTTKGSFYPSVWGLPNYLFYSLTWFFQNENLLFICLPLVNFHFEKTMLANRIDIIRLSPYSQVGWPLSSSSSQVKMCNKYSFWKITLLFIYLLLYNLYNGLLLLYIYLIVLYSILYSTKYKLYMRSFFLFIYIGPKWCWLDRYFILICYIINCLYIGEKCWLFIFFFIQFIIVPDI